MHLDLPALHILNTSILYLGEGDDQQWNGVEWNPAADELTWERLLGSFLFFFYCNRYQTGREAEGYFMTD